MSVMRGDTTPAERHETHMARTSTRQRIVVLTFDDAAGAEAFDNLTDAGVLEWLRLAVRA